MSLASDSKTHVSESTPWANPAGRHRLLHLLGHRKTDARRPLDKVREKAYLSGGGLEDELKVIRQKCLWFCLLRHAFCSAEHGLVLPLLSHDEGVDA